MLELIIPFGGFMNNSKIKEDFYSRYEIPAEIQSLIANFLERRKTDTLELKDSFKNKELEPIKKIAHKIKGHGTAYGFSAISEIGRRIENLIASDKVEELEAIIFEYENYVNKLFHEYGN